ncbi:3'-5' exonuclease [Pseudomonas kielensis]|uniref:3'-5' exonuclease n=1 Tax=Pseudomonas kielensis TaxID=2762577 RepID=UPI00265FB846|nr:3'-5' exonuclease [Pseudomonas kielensis]WKL53112.1 3'-5' exonuclease [Pseudomonas kielensis]
MNLLTPYDTETTGLPLFKEPSDDPRQPHLVDLCILAYASDGTLVDSFEAMVRPDGWVIPNEVAVIHGITTEMAMDMGISEAEALDGFMAIHERAGLRIAHNIQFDDRIMRIALSRYRGKEAADAFKTTPGYCTCQSSKNIVKCPPTEKMIRAGFGKQFKVPTVAEALLHFTGEELVGGHRARADAEGCARIYFAMNPPAQAA